jgi:creatinine amidohydrolase
MSAKPLPLMLKNLNSIEVENLLACEAPLFIPTGTLEAHGRHLPVGTDTLCAEKFSEELAIHFEGAVAPSIEYGVTNSLAQTAPASFFNESLYEEFVQTILTNFIRHGFKTIIVVNGHGGNMEPLKRIARKIVRHHRVALGFIHWWLLSEKFVEPIFKTGPGGHAAIEETAAMLHFHPTLVDPDNYKPENDDYVAHNSLWLYPPPGEVIIDQAETGQPLFDCGKAATFTEKVLEELKSHITNWLNKVNRLSGGLRP